MSPATVVILLATRNGERFLKEQLESYRAQTWPHWQLLVSDDGSTDGTRALVEAFAQSVPQRVVLRSGPQKGFWQNFMALARAGECQGDLFAFSDQDDIWHPEKLARAAAWFERVPASTPALYFSRTALIDDDGAPIGFAPLFPREPCFRNALVQNIGGGNTMTFNRAARELIRLADDSVEIVSHDWWAYQIVSGAGGLTYYDPWPGVQYRQHGSNIVGSNAGLRARLTRLLAFQGGRMQRWNDVNLAALNRFRDRLTPENRAILDRFAAARRAPPTQRVALLRQSGVYRQSAIENAGLYLGAQFGRV